MGLQWLCTSNMECAKTNYLECGLHFCSATWQFDQFKDTDSINIYIIKTQLISRLKLLFCVVLCVIFNCFTFNFTCKSFF